MPLIKIAQKSLEVADQFTEKWLASQKWWLGTPKPKQIHYPTSQTLPNQTLNLVSFNMQAGLNTQAYKDYLTHGWKQFLPTKPDFKHLNEITQMISPYDFIALQEVDGGSIRSGFVNHLSYFARQGSFDFNHQQLNRNLGRWGQFSNGVLSRFAPYVIEDHHLPGIPGRGAIVAKFGHAENPLVIVSMHLALGERSRHRQLDYVKSLIGDHKHVILMGDLNCNTEQLSKTPLKDIDLSHAGTDLHTYPSWSPKKNIDHILVSSSIEVLDTKVLDYNLSDHRPISMSIRLPDEVINSQSA